MKNKSLLMTIAIFLFAMNLIAQPIKKSNNNNIKTVTIGTQTWMAENLNVSTFRNGDAIPEVKTDAEWAQAFKEEKPAWCYYDNDPANGAKYGKLYNGYAVIDPRGLAPAGFHIPSEVEWIKLASYLDGTNHAAKKMKSTSGWMKDGNGTNESGFCALPGGYRLPNFMYAGSNAYWWSSSLFVTGTPGWGFFMKYNYDRLNKMLYDEEGLSVRCIKD